MQRIQGIKSEYSFEIYFREISPQEKVIQGSDGWLHQQVLHIRFLSIFRNQHGCQGHRRVYGEISQSKTRVQHDHSVRVDLRESGLRVRDHVYEE